MKECKTHMCFIVVKLKTLLKSMFAAILVVFMLLCLEPSLEIYASYTKRLLPVYCVDSQEKVVCLTFDAAWGSDKTSGILQILQKHQIKATFFLVGFWVDKNIDLTKEIFAQGHQIGSHSNTHPDMTKLSKNQIEEELDESCKKICSATGQEKVDVFRPPFGAYNNQLIMQCQNKNLQAIQWNIDTLDWKGISANQICANVFKKLCPGSIILCHNNSDNILQALEPLILGLKSRGYKFETVGNLLIKNDFRIDNTGKQIKI